jgi:hypothetical protein
VLVSLLRLMRLLLLLLLLLLGLAGEEAPGQVLVLGGGVGEAVAELLVHVEQGGCSGLVRCNEPHRAGGLRGGLGALLRCQCCSRRGDSVGREVVRYSGLHGRRPLGKRKSLLYGCRRHDRRVAVSRGHARPLGGWMADPLGEQ